ncbi:glycoside hydrolase family 95 protein [Plantibacter flavus]|uniref:glycosyl hydrolase family 95 catalytic domain-containing protein n=1 Tax=Plantibacter flavus TaxID=150123 RepID=UPI003F1642DE
MTTMSNPILWFERPGSTWFEGLPVGNGRSGAMVYGDLDHQALALNDEQFWSPGPRERELSGAREALDEVRDALASGEILQAQAAAQHLLGTPRLGAAFQPLGALELSVDEASPVSMRRSLDLADGVAAFEWTLDEDASVVRDVIASRTPSVFIVTQTGERATRMSVTSPFGATTDDGLVFQGRWHEVEPNRVLVADSYRAKHVTGGTSLHFGIGVRVLGGAWTRSGEHIVLEPGSWTIAVAVAVSPTADGIAPAIEALLDDAADRPTIVEDARAAHRAIFERSRVALHLDDAAALTLRGLPTDLRVHAVRAGGIDDELTLLMADYGRYLTIASSIGGTLPPTLQGVWNEDTEPAWCSNWTVNINAQMCLWSADPFHLTESVDQLADLVDGLAVAGQRTAREIYGAEGWVVHHNTDVWLNTAPTTLVEVGLFPAAGLWLVQQLWQHHERYPEREYAKRLLPALIGAATFVEGWLVEDEEGRLVPSPSSTPENAYLLEGVARPASRAVDPEYWRHGWLGIAPTLDIWLIRDTLRSAITAVSASAAAADAPERKAVARWVSVLERLPEVPIIDGEIPEWTWAYRALELGHRHLSPLYELYPGTDDYVSASPLADAARTTLLKRQANVESTSNGWGGWSRVWTAAAWARLRDGERALASLESVVRMGTAPGSLLHAFPEFDGKPTADAVHQSDANMGFPAALVELLVQSDTRGITLLPALPARWRSGAVTNLRAYGGVDVSFRWRAGSVTDLEVSSTVTRTVRLTTPHHELELSLVGGRPHTIDFTSEQTRSKEGTPS